jgi:hypothetical protein
LPAGPAAASRHARLVWVTFDDVGFGQTESTLECVWREAGSKQYIGVKQPFRVHGRAG